MSNVGKYIKHWMICIVTWTLIFGFLSFLAFTVALAAQFEEYGMAYEFDPISLSLIVMVYLLSVYPINLFYYSGILLLGIPFFLVSHTKFSLAKKAILWMTLPLIWYSILLQSTSPISIFLDIRIFLLICLPIAMPITIMGALIIWKYRHANVHKM
ncbi:MAG: hypothetical protein QW270_05400 [Candidatus Bathyarchaeia archaeon]